MPLKMPNRRPPTLIQLLTLLTVTVVTAGAAHGDPLKCRSAIAKAASKYTQARIKALSGCEKKVVSGILPPATDCATDPATTARITTAAAKLSSLVAKACGGADKTCGTAGDDALADLGWDISSCPDTRQAGCIDSIRDCDDISQCLTCLTDSATGELTALANDRLNLGGDDRILSKCQKSIGLALTKLVADRSKRLQKCWDGVNKGRVTGPCPSGDDRTVTAIAKAEAKMIAKICKDCGGEDKGCDSTVAGIAGTGGEDDLTPQQIGLPANCPYLTVPGAAASCARPISSLSDMVTCLACVADFDTACGSDAAVPWAAAYSPSCSDLVYAESFERTNGSAWPAPWTAVGGVETADILNGRARFRPSISFYSLARLYAPFNERDVDASFTFEFSDEGTQGVGFYVRQNGGYLNQTFPAGEGYAVFVEKFRPDGAEEAGIGLWYEDNGNEIPLVIQYNAVPISAGVRYRVRFRVHQSSPTETTLRAKMWPEADPEPAGWILEYVDSFAPLQGAGGGFAFDAWSDVNPATPGMPPASYLFVDDVEIRRLENPLDGLGALNTIQEGFSFLEGPRWRPNDGVLLFTDLNADTIYRLTPPATIDVFRTPASFANGLANDVNGDLLAAEHQTRRLTRTDSGSNVTTVVDNFTGDAFNSPNDIAVRSDGTIYFTDPRYGNPPFSQTGFAGLFRLDPTATASAEWMGGYNSTGPNGVDLSPDESTLYMAETDGGRVIAFDVAGDGTLANERDFATGMTIPDGMCVDQAGNLYVSTWAQTIEIFSPGGDRWTSIALPYQATNCGFGGSNGDTLYITTHQGLYSVSSAIPGIP